MQEKLEMATSNDFREFLIFEGFIQKKFWTQFASKQFLKYSETKNILTFQNISNCA